jgi:hypothetical protein
MYELLQNGHVIRQGQVDLSGVTGDSWVSVTFEKVKNSMGNAFVLRATVQETAGTTPEVRINEYSACGPWMKSNVFRRGKRWLMKRFLSSRRLACRYLFEAS